jgi:tetratricopeptide (TPR) repeat protein
VDGTGAVDAMDEWMRAFIDSCEEGTEEAVALRLLGQDLARRGLHERAETPFRRAIENGRSLSDKLPLFRSLIAFGSSRARAGDMEEARTLLDEAGALYREIFAGEPIDWRPGIGYDDAGERSPDAVTVKRDLALALIDTGLLEEAEELLRQVRAVHHGRARYATGRLLLAKGDAAAAEPPLHHALFSARWLVEEEPYRFARREIEYGQCLTELGRHAEAEELLTRAHGRALEWGGPHSSNVELAAEQLGRLRRVRGQADAGPGLTN